VDLIKRQNSVKEQLLIYTPRPPKIFLEIFFYY
jgi:hypothetical protein